VSQLPPRKYRHLTIIILVSHVEPKQELVVVTKTILVIFVLRGLILHGKS
jgi:hypothetical protein